MSIYCWTFFAVLILRFPWALKCELKSFGERDEESERRKVKETRKEAKLWFAFFSSEVFHWNIYVLEEMEIYLNEKFGWERFEVRVESSKKRKAQAGNNLLLLRFTRQQGLCEFGKKNKCGCGREIELLYRVVLLLYCTNFPTFPTRLSSFFYWIFCFSSKLITKLSHLFALFPHFRLGEIWEVGKKRKKMRENEKISRSFRLVGVSLSWWSEAGTLDNKLKFSTEFHFEAANVFALSLAEEKENWKWFSSLFHPDATFIALNDELRNSRGREIFSKCCFAYQFDA